MTDRRADIEELKKLFFKEVEENTPADIKENPVIDLGQQGEFSLKLNKELVKKFELWNWFENYKREAQHSTGGIRGPQNVLYPWDYRFILHELGVVLATLGKAAVLKGKITGRPIQKLCSGEVRYNTKKYIELISRLQAAQGILTHLPKNDLQTAIWMASFLIFKLDYDGGEYITSSHAISKKIATKDLSNQGSQFMPEESMEFVAEIGEILKQADSKGYEIKFSAKDSECIKKDFDGFELYTEYLRKGIASKENLAIINEAKEQGFKVIFETAGGCMYSVFPPILYRLGIAGAFEWNNKGADPFFHGIGKTITLDKKTSRERFTDLSCDLTLKEVVDTAGYEILLKDRPIGTVVLMTDPDADRLPIGQIEPAERIPKLRELEIAFIPIDVEKVFAFYLPNQSFLCTMDFHTKQLKKQGIWNKYSRIMITTTASAYSWVEWAQAQGVKVATVPVGFKEIAVMMKKIEKQMLKAPEKDVVILDAYGKKANLGKNPRLVFAGEESGGMIVGPEELIESSAGRKAIAMREKSAGEAAVLITALAARLFKERKFFSEYLEEIFKANKINYRFDYLNNLFLYDENIPDPRKLAEAKKNGELVRDKNDDFFTSIALAKKEGKISLKQAKEILQEALPKLDFSDLQDIIFVGDGTFLAFSEKFVENRKSGTDAKIKSYAMGNNKQDCIKYSNALGAYSGKATALHKKYIGGNFLKETQKKAREYYMEFLHSGL